MILEKHIKRDLARMRAIRMKNADKVCVNCGATADEEYLFYSGCYYYCPICYETKSEFKPEVKEKMCVKCGEIKKGDEFHKNKKSYDGLFNICKNCNNAYHRERSRKNK